MKTQTSREKLVGLLRLAYSAEMAAMFAYRGHWRSVTDSGERSEIRNIEAEEWLHRRQVGHILKELSARPRLLWEIKYFLIGRTLGWLCFLSGWFLPMYGAGRLESKNYREYEMAAEYALASGLVEYVDCLLTMAEVEWDHERYFRGKVEGHTWLRFFRLWEALPPRATIREKFRLALSSSRVYTSGETVAA